MESIAQGYPGYNISGGHYTAKKSQEERLDSLASIIYIGVTDTLSRYISEMELGYNRLCDSGGCGKSLRLFYE